MIRLIYWVEGADVTILHAIHVLILSLNVYHVAIQNTYSILHVYQPVPLHITV